MPKRILLAAVLFLLPFSAGARTLRLASVQSPDSVAGHATKKFATLAHKYSNGDLNIHIYPSGQLGDAQSVVSSVKTGGLDLGVGTFPLLANFVPQYNVYNAGFFYDSWPQLRRVIRAANFGQKWNQLLLKRSGIRVLGSFYYGARDLTTKKTSVKKPADLAGKKIRSVPNQMSLAVIRGLGATPTPVPFPDLFQALSQGVVDGQENPLPTIEAQHIYEVQHYLMTTRHQLIALPWIANQTLFSSLSKDDRHALRKAAHDAAKWASRTTVKTEKKLLSKLKKQGMTIITEQKGLQRQAFRESVRRSVMNEFEGKVWPKGLAKKVINKAHPTDSDAN